MFTDFNVSADNKRLSFTIKHLDVAYANALRRVILSEIPMVAIAYDAYDKAKSDINIIENTSVLHNEFIGHRISLIPLHLTKDHIQQFDPTEHQYELTVKNTSNEVVNVTTNDIRRANNSTSTTTPPVEAVFPVDPLSKDGILITKLKPNFHNPSKGESLSVLFTARKGVALDHARWCPVSTCTYFYVLDEVKIAELRKDVPADKLNYFDSIEKQRHYVADQFGEPNEFRFTVESECGMSSRDIVCSAFDVLYNKLQFMKEPDKFQLQHESDMAILTILGEDHTMGNLLQSFLYNQYCRGSNVLSFVGYYQPHPLDRSIVFKLKSAGDNSMETFLQESTAALAEVLMKLKKDFMQNYPDRV